MNLKRIYFGPIESERHEDETEEQHQLKSLLNIIADSGIVEVYRITRGDMSYLNEKQ
jgi:hypothetical protein